MSQKEKKWFKSAFSDEASLEESQPPSKLLRTNNNSISIDLTRDDSLDHIPFITPNKIRNTSNNQINTSITDPSNWLEYFAPHVVSDLAIHPKKITEVQDWFQHYELSKKKYRGQMLLITGPSGSGKTATVKAVASEMKYEIVEWINPIDLDFVRNKMTTDENENATYREPQMEIFKQFLFKSSRYKSVFELLQRRLVLVEDFPNILVRDAEGFEEILQNYRNFGKSPLVFIVTDSKSKQLNLSYTLFPDSVKGHHQIAHISFNPISTTLMKKALTRISSIIQQENSNRSYKIPAGDTVDSIILASQGDIRNAILNLRFASLRGVTNLQVENQSKAATSKGKKAKTKSLKSIGRDESITLMHALGRVFNPKFEQNGTQQKFLHCPEDIVSGFSSEPKMFIDFLHANYLAHFSSVESALSAANVISLGDQLMTEYREDAVGYIGLNIAVRGLMTANAKPVTGWIPVRGFKRSNANKIAFEEELRKLDINNYELSRNVLVSDYRTYAKIIRQPIKN